MAKHNKSHVDAIYQTTRSGQPYAYPNYRPPRVQIISEAIQIIHHPDHPGDQVPYDAVNTFVSDMAQKVFPNDWEEAFGTAITVTHEGVGIFISNIPDESDITFAAGILTGLELSLELVHEVAEVNRSTKVGGVYLSRGTTDWQLVYTSKVLKSWIDPSSRASAQMLVDILSNIPALVNIRAGYLMERVKPASRWILDDGWPVTLLSHI